MSRLNENQNPIQPIIYKKGYSGDINFISPNINGINITDKNYDKNGKLIMDHSPENVILVKYKRNNLPKKHKTNAIKLKRKLTNILNTNNKSSSNDILKLNSFNNSSSNKINNRYSSDTESKSILIETQRNYKKIGCGSTLASGLVLENDPERIVLIIFLNIIYLI